MELQQIFTATQVCCNSFIKIITSFVIARRKIVQNTDTRKSKSNKKIVEAEQRKNMAATRRQTVAGAAPVMRRHEFVDFRFPMTIRLEVGY
jgi:hypothetical protein